MFLIGGIFWIDSDSLYFLGVVAMVGTILMVKGESKFSVDNFFYHFERTCCCHVDV